MIGTARERFPIKFFLVCLLFILLDVDAAFLYPWALVVRELGLFGLIEMIVFLFILIVGYAYAWRQGALEHDIARGQPRVFHDRRDDLDAIADRVVGVQQGTTARRGRSGGRP